MPTCGHAVDIRAKSFPPVIQQLLLLLEAIKQQRLNAAGSYYRALPRTTRRQMMIFYHRQQSLPYRYLLSASGIPPCRHAVDIRTKSFPPAIQQLRLLLEANNRGRTLPDLTIALCQELRAGR
ncbi:hypothetical protein HX037_07360 [Ignatzschineria indica]|uniref:hypothetical protein n=1 Tax=Ignatzschineria indica TaxID=472583 RepID=UPI002577A2AE|nr:hypothetical protein [Ignatzschineria indica]MDM1545691.1 hypothetical protein [Ignatzschineria indica]